MTEPERYFTEWEDLNYKPYCMECSSEDLKYDRMSADASHYTCRNCGHHQS